jgi:hypothetical protein
LESDSFVQTKNSAVVQTIEPCVNLNYGAHGFRRVSAHCRVLFWCFKRVRAVVAGFLGERLRPWTSGLNVVD